MEVLLSSIKINDMKKALVIFLLGFLVFIIGCTTEEPDCEDCFDGEVTCLVNGEKWEAQCESGLFGCTPYNCRYYQNDSKAVEFSASNSNSDSRIFFGVTSNQGGVRLGENQLHPWKNSYNDSEPCGWHYTDSTKPRNLDILSIDTLNRIIEGEFNYTAVGECGNVVEITNGYFKVDYRLE